MGGDGMRMRAGLFAVVLMMVMSLGGLAGAQTPPIVVEPSIMRLGPGIRVTWNHGGGGGLFDMDYLAGVLASPTIVRIDGVDYTASPGFWDISSTHVGLLYSGVGGPLPVGTVTRMTAQGRSYMDHAGYRLLLPNLPDPAPAPVPTLSEWALIVMGLLLAGIALVRGGYAGRAGRC